MDMHLAGENKAGLVSIIMPAYNASRFIRGAIDSILGQTYKNFEFIIINDGSSDDTLEIIYSYNDHRIRVIDNKINKGLIYSLNTGLQEAKGEYIARMDADDISLPQRIKKQVYVLDNNPNIIVCGTQIEYFGNSTGKYSRTQPKTHSNDIKTSMLVRCGFAHPSVMIRSSILKRYNLKYDPAFQSCEDYKLWIDLFEYGDFYNIPIPLLKYRVSEGQISSKYHTEQLHNAGKCQNILFEKLSGIKLSPLGIDLKTLKSYRKLSESNRYVIPFLYQRLIKLGLREIIFYIISLDCFRSEWVDNINLIYKYYQQFHIRRKHY